MQNKGSYNIIHENPKYIVAYNKINTRYYIFEKKLSTDGEMLFPLLYDFDNKETAIEKFQILTSIFKGIMSEKELQKLGFIEIPKPKNGLRPIQFEIMDEKVKGWFHQWYVSKEFNPDTRRTDETLLALIELKDGTLVTRKYDKVKFLDVLD